MVVVIKSSNLQLLFIFGIRLAQFVNMKTRETVGPMEHGEIAFRSPAMMRGYYKRPEETAQVVDSDGWCLTGE
ncbi:hypothetical protein HPB48_008937 [Haemaphysalis longicornis]|uniref:AMP-dependent synthetase/ligase domain-containing protein n=1 Tax=Haemaphysalis longicornis TaxID=44386 RepID=A0A9J6GVR6_HAELO|nr:hypothetical protein HPB48_008937 [Haemaphysalis longicornis]